MVKQQAADALTRLYAERVDNEPLEDKLPVFLVEQTAVLTNNESNMFVQGPRIKTPLQPVIQVDGVHLATPSLTEFIKAQIAATLR